MAEKPKLLQWATQKYGHLLVAERISDIIRMTKEHNEDFAKVRFSEWSTLQRLERLANEDMNIEYMTLAGGLVELKIKRLIRTYEFTVNSSLVLIDFNTELKANALLSGKTIGKLVEELRKYCSDKSLLSKLADFGGKWAQVKHKLYEKHEDIEKVNQGLRRYVQNNPVGNLLDDIDKMHDSLINDLESKLSEYGLK